MNSYSYYDRRYKGERIMRMISIKEQSIQNIPSLIVAKENNLQKPLPTVIYYHGFTSAKEHNLPLAYLLALEGFRVVLPDSIHHGAREGEITSSERELKFWEIVLQNITEIKLIKRYLDDNHLLFNDRIGVAGTSMGGITTAALLVAHEWIDVAAILMGSAKVTSFAKYLISQVEPQDQLPPEKEINELLSTLSTYDLSKHIYTLKDRPLYIWHGDADRTVPFNHAKSFYEQADKYYTNKKHIKFRREINCDHKVSRPAILETVDWFKKYL